MVSSTGAIFLGSSRLLKTLSESFDGLRATGGRRACASAGADGSLLLCAAGRLRC